MFLNPRGRGHREHRAARSGPTHSINGTHYINGGVRFGENADLASGYANVVVLSPFGGRSQTPPERGAATDPPQTRWRTTATTATLPEAVPENEEVVPVNAVSTWVLPSGVTAGR